MEATQVSPEITNEESFVVPFVTAHLLGEFPDSTGKPNFVENVLLGAIAIHNELGSNKSILLPLMMDQTSGDVVEVVHGSRTPSILPEWYRNEVVARANPNPVKRVREDSQIVMGLFGDHLAINRALQVNILVPQAEKDFVSLSLRDKLAQMHYEILIGDPSTDTAEARHIVEAGKFYQNGHVIEAMLRKSLMAVWGADDLDMPSGYCRDVRWLSAQYLSKNTRGNLFPQLMPTLQNMFMQHESKLMADTNSTWGALAGLTAIIRR